MQAEAVAAVLAAVGLLTPTPDPDTCMALYADSKGEWWHCELDLGHGPPGRDPRTRSLSACAFRARVAAVGLPFHPAVRFMARGVEHIEGLLGVLSARCLVRCRGRCSWSVAR
ncbi:hypothetical protein Slala03_77010 [Streptomyces lavendulae subsp. lavendulae]|nr:hypothetical protein Slala03_77010 [Streptomyces lavendulae subsp. lavendulae]